MTGGTLENMMLGRSDETHQPKKRQACPDHPARAPLAAQASAAQGQWC